MSSKTILIQLLHKSEVLKKLNIKTLLVIQDNFLEHLKENYEISRNFRKQDLKDQIHIHAYSFNKKNNEYKLELNECISTDLEGLHLSTKGKKTSELKIQSIKEPIFTRIKEGKSNMI